jgi:hypothetical protein
MRDMADGATLAAMAVATTAQANTERVPGLRRPPRAAEYPGARRPVGER